MFARIGIGGRVVLERQRRGVGRDSQCFAVARLFRHARRQALLQHGQIDETFAFDNHALAQRRGAAEALKRAVDNLLGRWRAGDGDQR